MTTPHSPITGPNGEPVFLNPSLEDLRSLHDRNWGRVSRRANREGIWVVVGVVLGFLLGLHWPDLARTVIP